MGNTGSGEYSPRKRGETGGKAIIFQKLKTNLWTSHEHERNSEIFVRVNRLPVRDTIGSMKDSSPLSSSHTTSHSTHSPI